MRWREGEKKRKKQSITKIDRKKRIEKMKGIRIWNEGEEKSRKMGYT